MARWNDLNEVKPKNESEYTVLLKDGSIIDGTYAAPMLGFIDYDNDGRFYFMDEIEGWMESE